MLPEESLPEDAAPEPSRDLSAFRLDKSQFKVSKLSEEDELEAAVNEAMYWLSRPPHESIAALEFLRSQHAGTHERLQRVYRIIKRKPR